MPTVANHPRHAHALRDGYVISDLHLFSDRSTAAQQIGRIRRTARGADFLVLNGDIFDFEWSTMGPPDAAAEMAVDLLASLVAGSDGCQVFYVLGNHDRFRFFATHLDTLAREHATFHWHPTHVRLGRCLFLHGDLMFDRRCEDPFGGDMADNTRTRSQAMHLGYRALIATRVHRFAKPFYRPRRCARRILGCLRRSHPTLREGLTDVYFGHTHRGFANFHYEGITFHNSGCAIRHLESRLFSVTT